ncbi:tyrosine-type recombinase/integrase [Asticcacaulis excentricus]|nr:site-specific integrase [Asticcacaulis excentricus]
MLAGALRTPKVTNHAAIVEAKPLGGLLRAIDGFEGYKPIGYALKLSPHVFVRPSELRRAEWTEFNLDEAYWRIPANRMKMGREHWVPLSRQSVTLLLDLNEITGNHVYLFPSIRTWQRPMSENAVNVALRRLGYGPDEMTGHGFRSTASTLLNESGLWQPDAIEVALVHKDKNKVRGTYNRGRYWSERVEMAQWWSDHPYAHGWGRVYPQTVPLSPEAAEQLQTKQQALEDLLVPFEGADELPDEIDQAAGVLEAEIATLEAPQDVYDPQDIARGGVFVTLLSDGGAAIHRGLIRPEDALPEPETPEPETEDFAAHPDDAPEDRVGEEEAEGAGLHTEDTEDASEAAPVSDLLLRDLTTHWTLALRYTLAEQPELAARYLVHRLALDTFYRQRSVTCLDITARSASIESFAEGLDDSPTAAALAARHEAWAAGLPDNPADLWPHLLTLNAETLGSLMAHCTVLTVFAVRQAYMPAAPYVASLMMARDLRLNMTDHWTPTARSYFSRVTKGQILAAVREAVGDEAARRLHKLKKPEMAEAAEQLVQGTGWLPACLRTPAPPEETAQAPLALPLSEPTPDLPEAAE